MSLTHKQTEMLRFIIGYQAGHDGVAPTFEEMRSAVRLSSKSSVYRLLDALEDRGYLRRMYNRARGLEVLKTPPSAGPTDLIGNRCPHCSGIISIPFKGQVS